MSAMRSFLDKALDQPIMVKDGLFRMRSMSTAISVTLYVIFIGIFGFVMLTVTVNGAPNESPDAGDMAQAAFYSVAMQLALVILFVPGMTASSISGEKERGTLDMLLLGAISTRAITISKLVSSVSYVVVLMVASAPVLLGIFLYAGLQMSQLLATQAVVLGVAIAVSAIATMLSALIGRSNTATVASYGVCLLLYVGLALLAAIPTVVSDKALVLSSVHPLLFSNPLIAALAALLAPGEGVALGRLVQQLFFGGGKAWAWGPSIEPWQLSLILQLVISVVCVWITERLLSGRKVLPVRRKQPKDGKALKTNRTQEREEAMA